MKETEKQPEGKQPKKSYKAETLKFLKGELDLVNLEYAAERTKANFMKDKEEYKRFTATVQKQMNALEDRQKQIKRCIDWVASVE